MAYEDIRSTLGVVNDYQYSQLPNILSVLHSPLSAAGIAGLAASQAISSIPNSSNQIQPIGANNWSLAKTTLNTASNIGSNYLQSAFKPSNQTGSVLAKNGTTGISSGLASGLSTGAGLVGGLGASLNTKLNSDVTSARETLRSGLSFAGPIGAAVAAGTAGLDFIGDITGIGLDSLDRNASKRAGISGAATANNIIGAIPGLGTVAGIFGGKTKQAYRSSEIDNLTSAYGGTTADIGAAGDLSRKRTLFGKKKVNRFIDQQNRNNTLLTQIGQENEERKSNSYADNLASQNYNRYIGNTNRNLVVGKKGIKIPKLEDARKILKNSKPIIQEVIEQEIEKFANGGKMNVIAEGALHARKNNLSEVNPELENVTKKGIPVVVLEEGGEINQTAEIEHAELVLTKELTDKIEALYKDGSKEAMIEAGKLLAEELINNTIDNTNKLLDDEMGIIN